METKQVQDGVSDTEIGINAPVFDDGSSQKKVHQFYFIKFWPYEDHNNNVRSRIEETEKLIAKINEEELPIIEKLNKRMYDRYHVRSLCYQSGIRSTLDHITWKLDCLQEALDKQNFAKNASQRTAIESCSARQLTNFVLHRPNNLVAKKQLSREISEGEQRGAVSSFSSVEELSKFIRWLYRSIEVQSNDKARKTILKEIKQFECLEKKAVENAKAKGKKEKLLVSRKAIQDQIRLMNKISEDLREVRLKEISELEVVDKDINSLGNKQNKLRRRRDEAEQRIRNMRRQKNEVQSRYYRYVSVTSIARELATKKEVTALEELSHREIENFMSHWNKSKTFRRDYKKRILTSLDHRQLGGDGRIRNLDE